MTLVHLDKPGIRLLVALTASALLLAACGSSSDEDETTQPGPTTSSSAEPTSADDMDDTEPAAAPSPGGDTKGLDLNLFMDGALVDGVITEPCTLSGGGTALCHRITVVGHPVDHEIGPFCPTTTSTPASEAGVWFDGVGLYDLDGAFVLGLAELYDDDHWRLHDEDGNVNVTDTPEAFAAAARPDVAAEYQNHCVEGRIEWLADGEPVPTTALIPATPVPAENPGTVRHRLGITLNGVSIAAQAPMQAILGAYTIAAFDDCGGHINPFEGYHLHGATGCSGVELSEHGVILGYALDGYSIYRPDGDGEQAFDDLDICGGHTTSDLGYHYHASPAAANMVIGCLSGEIAVSD